tara:strand:- start:19 stop:948 length:930 start_codon:yes stop_codon:yes gene_type:complete
MSGMNRDLSTREMPDLSQVEYTTDFGQSVVLEEGALRDLIMPFATDHEVFYFMKFCMYMGLNPFIHEVYPIKFRADEPIKIVVDKHAVLKRAHKSPDFRDVRAGIIVWRDECEVELPSIMRLHSDETIGGWCRVYRHSDGPNGREPLYHAVPVGEYDTGNGPWRSHLGTMIRKVAMVQALREAFPELLGGIYDAIEFDTSKATVPPLIASNASVELLSRAVPDDMTLEQFEAAMQVVGMYWITVAGHLGIPADQITDDPAKDVDRWREAHGHTWAQAWRMASNQAIADYTRAEVATDDDGLEDPELTVE